MERFNKFVTLTLFILIGVIYAYIKKFINKKVLLIIICLCVLMIIFLYIKNKKNITHNKKHKKKIIKNKIKKNKKKGSGETGTPKKNINEESTEIPIYHGNNEEKDQ